MGKPCAGVVSGLGYCLLFTANRDHVLDTDIGHGARRAVSSSANE
jgi:hypothetical protein